MTARRWLAPGVVAASALACYAPDLRELARRWADDPNSSHGFLVAPAVALILWMRRGDLDVSALRPGGWGWPLLLATLALRAWLFERNEAWLGAATLIPAVASLAMIFGGRRLLLWSLPGWAFLAFLLPIPPRLNLILAGPLQRAATVGATAILQAGGLPVLAAGNVIHVGATPLEVERACNGLSMLTSFAMLVAASTLLARSRPAWERVALILSTGPIALACNVLRIAATAWAYHGLGPERGERLAHDAAGWAMMPAALAMVWAELKLLSWLVVAEELPTGPSRALIGRRAPAGAGP